MENVGRRTFLRGALAAGAVLALPWPTQALPEATPPISYQWFSEYSVHSGAWIRRLEIVLPDGRVFEAADLADSGDIPDPADPASWEPTDRGLWMAAERLLKREGIQQ